MKSSGNGIRGIVAIVVAFFFCPCHLPITFPIIVALASGSAIGVWLSSSFMLVTIVFATSFLGMLALGFRALDGVFVPEQPEKL